MVLVFSDLLLEFWVQWEFWVLELRTVRQRRARYLQSSNSLLAFGEAPALGRLVGGAGDFGTPLAFGLSSPAFSTFSMEATSRLRKEVSSESVDRETLLACSSKPTVSLPVPIGMGPASLVSAYSAHC